MNKFLIINHFIKGTYITSFVGKVELIGLKQKDIDKIIDLTNNTYFDAETNKWEPIKEIS